MSDILDGSHKDMEGTGLYIVATIKPEYSVFVVQMVIVGPTTSSIGSEMYVTVVAEPLQVNKNGQEET